MDVIAFGKRKKSLAENRSVEAFDPGPVVFVVASAEMNITISVGLNLNQYYFKILPGNTNLS